MEDGKGGERCQGNNPEHASSHSLDKYSPDFALSNELFPPDGRIKTLAGMRDADELQRKVLPEILLAALSRNLSGLKFWRGTGSSPP
jgi:hypothetical protein